MTTRTILFLDDDETRTESFLRFCPIAKTAKTSEEMIKLLSELKEPAIAVFLDHDLGGEIFVDSNREDCGMEVVRWIRQNKPLVEQFIVHSHNEPAAKMMNDKLIDAGYNSETIPFFHLKSRIKIDVNNYDSEQ